MFKYGVQLVRCESNMGHGLFEINLRSEILKASLDLERSVQEREFFKIVGVVGEYSTGQKERRIIDSFVSATQRHKVIVHQQVFDSDAECSKQHSIEKRAQYSMFYQFANITTDRGSLEHDDRVETAAGAVRYWKAVLVVDEDKAADARAAHDAREFIQNPMGYPDQPKKPKGIRGAMYKRRR
jgi:hypothetical protein